MSTSKVPSGILGFPVTPFTQRGKVDVHALEANVEFLVRSGLSAVFVCCGSGEFQSLSLEECMDIIDTAVGATKGRVPVYVGVGGNLSMALRQLHAAEAAGVDGCLIFPPYLIHGEQEGLYEYVKTIASSSDLNTIIYQRDSAIFTVETVQRLAEIPQVVGLKDGHGNMELNIELVQTLGDRLAWCNGMPFAEVTMPAYAAVGFRTYSSAISNYIPHISRMFFTALENQDREQLHALYQVALMPINQIRKLRKGYAVSLIKAGMEIMGLPTGSMVRPPLVPVEPAHYHMLERVLESVLQAFPVP
ncbi:5-dehydro-4-deoxyglucarate dehydratase [Alicyclobacillus cycloheptanicus]|uniref:Probable 5-dehydro-4-deoxyglucarate dehydratase n=2 Tax=Alicyclobacillus cycloheptanicus TaxID=1457 RepID=A0ABT9XGT9_9BACL|nr:5-dehydro-4-deoxyglucarate dehydratase [Alicyclobacillus cycloheptanicus]MDQ0189508.1 5-dehydro-4-deoxyglucarate dehydratase [Alicyclobacillus cycloheptanicus]WDM01570.1 5-dehydro-4-deoxyglucarate dehydratase [Alicyclobacillus cycloheptanicus]